MMHSWEFVVIAVGAVLVALGIYTFTVLRKLSAVLDSADELIKANTGKLSGIIGNVDVITEQTKEMAYDAKSITSDAKSIVTDVRGSVESVKGSLGEIKNKVSGVGKKKDTLSEQKINRLISTAGTVVAIIRIIKNRRRDRQLKKLRKEAKNK